MENINSKIFKAYDIRGLYPEEVNEEVAYNVGRALVILTGAKRVVVGRDMRESSVSLEKSVVEGIIEQGADVIRIGLSSTPMVYFASASKELNADAAIMITASHNPAEYNGMKLCRKGSAPIGEGSGMEEIKKMSLENDFPNVEIKGTVLEDEKTRSEYFDFIASFFKKGFKNKVVVDFANGMGIADEPIYEKLSKEIESVYLYDELNGNFPNHEANPIKTETLEVLRKKTVEEKAQLGIAYDGDADRVGFIDEKGEVVPMDYIIAILAKEILKKYQGGLVLMDLRSSNAVKEAIEEAGGKVHRCRVGHALIKKQMREEGAIFAGELSGHYFFEENSKSEMATLAVVMILNLMNETGKKMSELTESLKRYFHSGEMNFEVEEKAAVMNQLKEKYKEGKLDEMDGVRIDFSDWWFSVRASNTEPKLRLNLEAKTKKLMEEKKEEIIGVIQRS